MSQTGWPCQMHHRRHAANSQRHRRSRAAAPSTPLLPWDSGADQASSRKLAAGLWHLRFDEIPAPPQVESCLRCLSRYRAAEGSPKAAEDDLRRRRRARELRRKTRRLLVRLEEQRAGRGCDAAEELAAERKSRRRTELGNAGLADRLAEANLACEMLARRCAEEKWRRVAAEEACGELARQIGEVEEDRRMLEVAEAWREERVQMKLADASLALEDGFAKINLLVSELDSLLSSPARRGALIAARRLLRAATESLGGGCGSEGSATSDRDDDNCRRRHNVSPASAVEEQKRWSASVDEAGSPVKLRRAPENPHIARGMKGCIEWPRAAVLPRSVLKAKF